MFYHKKYLLQNLVETDMLFTDNWRDCMKKKLILLIVLTFVITTLSGVPNLGVRNVEAATTFQKVNFTDGEVTSYYLNVRQGPSSKYNIVCVLEKGDKVKIFGKIGSWYAIYEPKSGCVGAVSSKYIKVPGNSTQAPAQKKTQTQTPQNTQKTTQQPKQETPPAAQAPSTTDTGLNVSDKEQELLNLVNKARADAGLQPLQFDKKLMEVARLKAKDMVDNNYFSHQSPTYGSPFDMMRQFDVEFKTAGENIAGNRTVEGAFQAWMNSEGHRKNILNSKFNYTGIGIVESKSYGLMLVQQFIGK